MRKSLKKNWRIKKKRTSDSGRLMTSRGSEATDGGHVECGVSGRRRFGGFFFFFNALER